MFCHIKQQNICRAIGIQQTDIESEILKGLGIIFVLAKFEEYK
jgi:hypothetical protein